ncbi:MAG: hypothetical protein BRC25_02260 [Parcubacteria group bacterium SW_6_46_9]|nr:MAG: hypothetical protein BRC25_02260 [Parcubacteria group bacterium SW_6_46_9]
MNPQNEEKLVLVHSFPTNSILLSGLVDYLEDYFNLHFIDLPGFTAESPYDGNKITLSHFSEYVEDEIDKLDWDNYIVGGISFGFLVINQADINENKCQAMIAVEPYLNSKYLHLGFIKKFLYGHLIDEILKK